MAWRLTIAGVDRTVQIDRAMTRPSIDRILNERARARFRCTAGLVPGRFTEVAIFAQDGATKLFGGVVTKRAIAGQGDQGAGFWTDVECGDYFTYFDWAFLSLTYTAPVTTKAVLTDIVAALPPSYGITLDAGQVDGPTLAPFAWDRKRASDAVRELSDRTGLVAVVSPLKALKLFVPGTDAAPFALTPTGRKFTALTWADSDQTPANKVTCLCGPTAVVATTQTWTQAAAATTWTADIPTAPAAPPPGYVTVGGIFRTVGPGAAYEWNAATSTLSLGTDGAPANGTVISLVHNAQFPFAVTATSGATPVIESQLTYPDVTDYAQGLELAVGLLDQLNQQPRALTIASIDGGWEPGQALTVALAAARDFDASALITRVGITLQTGASIWRYSLAATESPTYNGGSYLNQWRQLLGGGSGGGAGVALTGGSGGPTMLLTSPVYLGGDRGASVPMGSPPAYTPVLNYLPFVAASTFTGRVRVDLWARHAGVGVRARLYNVTDSTSVLSSLVTSIAAVETTFVVAIVAGKTYRLDIISDTNGESGYAIGQLEGV